MLYITYKKIVLGKDKRQEPPNPHAPLEEAIVQVEFDLLFLPEDRKNSYFRWKSTVALWEESGLLKREIRAPVMAALLQVLYLRND